MNSQHNNFDESQAIAVLEHLAKFAGPVSETLSQRLLAPRQPKPVDGGGDSVGQDHRWKPDLRYRSLVERLPVVTFMASLDDTVQELYVSPQIETLLGFTQEEWLDNPVLWFQQLHPDDRDKWVQEFARTCAEGVNFRAEYRLFARDGHVVWVQGECQLIRDDDGRPLFLQGVAFDITHLKEAASAQEARLAAEAANKAKSEFLARMSHEIRTPLNGVVGMIDLLAASPLNDTQARYAKLAREAADSLLLVINDILDFSKIEAGKVEVEAIEFDLHKVVEDVTILLTPLAAKKKLHLASLIRFDVPHGLIGDPNRIRQVLTNLITNAIKFTERGQVSVRAARVENRGESCVVRLEVQDTGIGIPPERIDRLFKSFSQVDTSTTRKYGGTGLGLAICKRLVELMGGEIGISSELGKGTTFWFTLTLGRVATAAADSALDQIRSVRVLAVEPDPHERRILAEQFDGLLCEAAVIVDENGALTALRNAAAAGRGFDVALLPFEPATVDLAAKVHGEPALRTTKLIAITALEDRTDSAAVMAAAFCSRLARPLTQSQLIDSIATAMLVRAPAARPAAGGTDGSLKGLHVLVAEDNEMNQFVTQQTLLRVGCTCDIVADGALAIEAVASKTYAAVLMDCQMPNVDGLEATRQIREREKANGTRRVPIIALTAEAISGDREKCLAAGMDGYVSKPINAAELFGELARIAQTETKATVLRTDGDNSVGEAAPIDTASLLTRCMGDGEFAKDLLQKFGKRAVDDVVRLRAGIESGDAAGAERMSHNLKAVAAHVSAEKVRAIAFEIEKASARRDLKFIELQVSQLDEEVRRCASFIPTALAHIDKKSGPDVVARKSEQ